MSLRFLLLAGLFFIACGKSKQPTPETQKEPIDLVTTPTPEVKVEEEVNKPQAQEEPVAPTIDKERLARTYLEIYCAQKKGEMDKILNIYKANGFDTPQEFTKAWIEAAKDTDWVTKIAWDVSKKCK